MLKQRPLTPARRTNAVVKCGLVVLGAGVLGLTASATAQAAAPGHGTVTGNGVNVRSSPSLRGTIVGHKDRGDHVSLYCSFRSADGILWDEIQVPSQWMAANYVHVVSGTVPPCDGLGRRLAQQEPQHD